MKSKYTKRQIVYSRSRPSIKLVIRWNIDRLYFCHVMGDPKQREQVYVESELLSEEELEENYIMNSYAKPA